MQLLLSLIVYHNSSVTFLLTVTDVNDNCPQFVGSNNNNGSFIVSVSEVFYVNCNI